MLEIHATRPEQGSTSSEVLNEAVVARFIWALLWGYAILTAVSLFGTPLGEFDDAIPLVHGLLVQEGRTPNLDFYSFYPPLNAYVNAAAFSLLGRTVLATRAVTAVLYIAVLFLAAQFFRSRLTRSSMLVAISLLLVATSIGTALSLPVFPGFALSVCTVLLYFNAGSYGRIYPLIVAVSGVLAAIALLYRVNFGMYAIAVIAADLLLPSEHESGRFRLTFNYRAITSFLISVAVFGAAICLWIYGKRAGIALSEFVITAQRLMALRGFITLRFTADVASAVVLPLAWFFFRIGRNKNELSGRALLPVVLAFCLLLLTVALGNFVSVVPLVVALEITFVLFLHTFVDRLPRAELATLLLFCCLLHYFLSRADWMHWRLLPIAVALLLPFGILSPRDRTGRDDLGLSSSNGLAFRVIAGACFLLIATENFRPAISYVKSGTRLLIALAHNPHLTDTGEVIDSTARSRGWSTVYPNRDQLEALRYLRARTSSSDPIFVGVQDHSRIFWNDLLVYWLAGRPIGVRTFQLETRVATEPLVQREIIEDLEKNRVRWVVLNCAPQVGDDTFKARAYRGSTMLDEYIANHFQQRGRFGVYAVLSRI